MTEVLQIAKTWQGVPIPESEQVTVLVDRSGAGLRLRVEAPFHGDPAPPARPGPCDRLWEFEVVEVFLAGPPDDVGRIPYTEVELSPHGHHLVLRMLGVRNAIDWALPLVYRAEIAGNRWRGEAVIPASFLPPLIGLTGNAYAIHGPRDARRYLAAIPLPGPRPNFHQPDRFRPLDLEG
ncbi:MAG: hypothetical protein ABI609_07545 [Acidobacteriota bacterium]